MQFQKYNSKDIKITVNTNGQLGQNWGRDKVTG